MRGLTWIAMGLLVGGCSMMEKPSVKVANVSMGDTSLKATTIIFDMEVTNPYGVPLPLTGADYALSTGGQQFVNGKADMFNAEGTAVALDGDGWGAVTLDFACYGCHNDSDGVGGGGSIKTLAELAARAATIHTFVNKVASK